MPIHYSDNSVTIEREPVYSYTRKYMVIVTIHVIMLGCDVHLNFGDLCTVSRRVQVHVPSPTNSTVSGLLKLATYS